MTQLLVFLLGTLVALMLLGHLATPLGERQPLRRWTPVYLMDRVPHAITLFRDAGALQRRRFEDAAAERESQVKDQGRRVEDAVDGEGSGGFDGREDRGDLEGEDPRGRT
ncbi:hypothetical protein [Ornithinimicrobium sufpigmenti]|uniref:hypothetical protein n=1 Tax=Ornithinimicrobium sufpigmenti TaxID=2508882 RepID=UPI001036E2DA|nr:MULTISPECIES: hypothetical protein [unclassified Ornithinimicrobium]